MIMKGFFFAPSGKLSGLKSPLFSHSPYIRDSVAAGSYGFKNFSFTRSAELGSIASKYSRLKLLCERKVAACPERVEGLRYEFFALRAIEAGQRDHDGIIGC